MAKWFYAPKDGGGKKIGPIRTRDLQQLARSGELKADDLIWKEGMQDWVPARRARGLFQEQTAPSPVPEPPTPSDPQVAVPSASPAVVASNEKSSAADGLKAAGQLAAKTAQKTKLTQFTLPACYSELGKHILETRGFEPDFAILFGKIQDLQTKLESLKSAETPPSNTFIEKAKAAAARAKKAAQQKTLQLQINANVRELGKQAYEKFAANSGPKSLVTALEDSLKEINSLNAQISNLSNSIKASRLQENRFVIGCVVLLFFPLGLFLVWRHSSWSRRHKLGWTAAGLVIAFFWAGFLGMPAPNVTFPIATADGTSPPTSSDAAAETPNEPREGSSGYQVDAVQTGSQNTVETLLPDDIAKQKPWPRLPITGIAHLPGVRYVHFSPKGKYLAVLSSTKGASSNFRGGNDASITTSVWETAEGKECIAKAADADYYSSPAVFSPDERHLVCIDGDFLRIWGLGRPSSSLVQSLRIPRPSNPQSPSDWLAWSGDTLAVCTAYYATDPRHTFDVSSNTCVLHWDSTKFVAVPAPKPLGVMMEKLRQPVWRDVSPHSKFFDFFEATDEKGARSCNVLDVQTGRESTLFAKDVKGGELLLPPQSGPLQWPRGFSPDGKRILLLKTNADSVATIWDTGSWKLVASLRVPSDGPEVDGHYDDSAVSGFSQGGESVAAVGVTRSRTSKGSRNSTVVLIWDSNTGRLRHKLPLATFVSDGGPTPLYQLTRDQKGQFTDFLAFSPDGRTVSAAVSRQGAWSNKNNTLEIQIDAKTWSLETGNELRSVTIRSTAKVFGGMAALSPDGRLLLTLSNNLNMWDLEQLSRLQKDFAEGDSLWSQGKHADAAQRYFRLVADKMTGVLGYDLARLYSRIVDYYAEKGQTANCRGVMEYAFNRKLKLAPETAKGASICEAYEREKAEAAARANREKAEQYTKRLAEIRDKNQSQYVPSRTLTKKEFIQKLKATMSQGRIDGLMQYAVFENYSFQDVFGDPDTNVEWIDLQRLVSYPCLDGRVQMTVMFLDSRTILNGINEY